MIHCAITKVHRLHRAKTSWVPRPGGVRIYSFIFLRVGLAWAWECTGAAEIGKNALHHKCVRERRNAGARERGSWEKERQHHVWKYSTLLLQGHKVESDAQQLPKSCRQDYQVSSLRSTVCFMDHANQCNPKALAISLVFDTCLLGVQAKRCWWCCRCQVSRTTQVTTKWHNNLQWESWHFFAWRLEPWSDQSRTSSPYSTRSSSKLRKRSEWLKVEWVSESAVRSWNVTYVLAATDPRHLEMPCTMWNLLESSCTAGQHNVCTCTMVTGSSDWHFHLK